jgi:hypothetical protein
MMPYLNSGRTAQDNALNAIFRCFLTQLFFAQQGIGEIFDPLADVGLDQG